MGVTGSGKTTIGQMLAKGLGWKFYDADDFHPKANVEKMRQGIPLTDGDRIPWLKILGELVEACLRKGENAVLACSALKKSYREYLLKQDREVKLVYLKGDYDLIQKRLEGRRGHYMNPKLLASQFATLEEPEGGLTVDISGEPGAIVALIRKELNLMNDSTA